MIWNDPKNLLKSQCACKDIKALSPFAHKTKRKPSQASNSCQEKQRKMENETQFSWQNPWAKEKNLKGSQLLSVTKVSF